MTAPATPAPILTGWAVLRIPDYRFFIGSRLLAGLALQMQNVGIGWFVYDRTNSALALGLTGLAAFAPALGLALVTGHVADQFDRRRIVAVCHAATALAAAGLLWCVWTPDSPIWLVYAFVTLVGASRAFGNPASQALLPNLVPRDGFGAAVSLNASIMQSSIIMGPAVGGLLYAVGPSAVFAAAFACFVVAALLVTMIRARQAKTPREKVTLDILLAGLRFIKSRPVVLGAISLDLFAVLLGGATALLPIFARDILHTGPWGLGLLRSMPALGAVLMSLLLTHRPIQARAGRRLFQAVGVFGVATIVFGLSSSLLLSALALVALGSADMVSVYVRHTLVQGDTPDAMRGRVSAVNSVFIGASNELGEFESGVLAALVGPVAAVVIGGVGTLLVAATWMKLFPDLRNRDRLI
ncbi:MFS transporter [Alsobacter sp. SYSU M60028]|uniref:MFS transporter n=1 Tax=Alsobacter ponti TaxID=2962936 RepID=A0ABT1LGD8_9HYPH|nr:MFS transporter [Alsobacter ponti]MCP8940567.1 MFS transporter [Alsobacter ponti]